MYVIKGLPVQKRTLALLIGLGLLAGCNSSAEKPPLTQVSQESAEEEHEDEMSYSRLVIQEADTNALHIYDAHEWNEVEQIELKNPPSGLKTSPDGRYALALQRNFNMVEVIDSGIEAEAHGDHYHLHSEEPTLLSDPIEGAKPTHFDVGNGEVALFFDGDKEAGLNAEFHVFDDEAFMKAQSLASYQFEYALHGTAQIKGEYAFTGIVAGAEGSALPDQVIALEKHGDHFHQLEMEALPCPLLHGSAQTENLVAFACSDGIVTVNAAQQPLSPEKIANPSSLDESTRFGKLFGFSQHDQLVAFSSHHQFYALKDNVFTEINWKQTPEDRALSYTYTDDELIVITPAGKLNVYDASQNFALSFSLTIWPQQPMLEKGQKVHLAFDKRHHHLFVTDPTRNAIIQIDMESKIVVDTHQLGFTPTKLTWTGTTKGEHQH